MESEKARQLVEDTFGNSFNEAQFLTFSKQLLKHLDDSVGCRKHWNNQYVREAFRERVDHYKRLGCYTIGIDRIDVLVVQLKRDTTLQRGRSSLRAFAAAYLSKRHKQAALIAFVSPSGDDWRFSFVKLETFLEDDRKELTPAKRFSFLVGKDEHAHTAKKQFLELLKRDSDPTLEQIESAFRIEAVTKEFYERYEELFIKTRDEIVRCCNQNEHVCREFIAKGMFVFATDGNGNEIFDELGEKLKIPFADDFAKKLLGQIVFLYFLQKKGWFGVGRFEPWGTGDRDFLRSIFKNRDAYKSHNLQRNLNFYEDILEPLFYRTLAKKRDSDWEDRFYCKIPFLNGGLFEPIYDYDWTNNELLLSDELFSNTEVSEDGDVGTGILDVFDRYNFTINEAEPLDVEVAVDPEMLGKVFENLLPENVRKGSGTFYTPRVIVAYMCQQTLVNHLASHLADVPRDDIEDFVRFGSQQRDYTEAGTESHRAHFIKQTIQDNATAIDRLLQTITVCDPAIGSGAFPVGMMQEIVGSREAISFITDPPPKPIKEMTVDDLSLEDARRAKNRYLYKRHAIEHSLYGVDYDPGAVEIAKLRLWLSLIVDEENFENIKPLPNLDYKIMQGNSLLEEFHGLPLFDEQLLQREVAVSEDHIRSLTEKRQILRDEYRHVVEREPERKRSIQAIKIYEEIMELDDLINPVPAKPSVELPLLHAQFGVDEKLALLKEKYKWIVSEFDRDSKRKLRKEAEDLEWDFIEAKLNSIDRADELLELRSREPDHRKPYFLWKMHFSDLFHKKGGFDIVLGNPPFLNVEQIEPETKLRFAAKYRTFYKRFDIFGIFFELSLTRLVSDGQVAFIIPSQILNNLSYKKLRELMLSNRWLNEVFYLGDKMFENASNDVCVLFLNKRGVDRIRLIDSLGFKHRKFVEVPTNYFEKFNGIISFSANADSDPIFDKIFDSKHKTIRTDFEVFQGIVTGNNDAFLLTDEQIDDANIEPELLHPILHGRDFGKWGIRNAERQIIYVDSQTKIDRFPNTKRWLSKFRESLVERRECKRGVLPWYALQWSRNKSQLDHIPKILLQRTRNPRLKTRIVATLDEKGFYGMEGIIFVVPKSSAVSVRYLLGVLNSTLINYLYQTKFLNVAVKGEYLKETPIPDASNTQLTKIETLVQNILEQKREDPNADASGLERNIDELVYQLYDITAEERAIIEAT